MRLPEGKLQALRDLLCRLDSRQLARLATLINAEEGSKSKSALCDALRPLLAELQPLRSPCPQRVLCQPFEDLLEDGEDLPHVPGRLSRAAIGSLWRLLTESVAPPDFLAAMERFGEAAMSGNEIAIALESRSLWRAAADGLADVLEQAPSDPAMRRRLRIIDAGHLPELHVMVGLLDVAETVEEMKRLLPAKPIEALTADDVAMLTRLYHRVAALQPGREEYVLTALVCRLAYPSELVTVARALAGASPDMIGATSLARIGDLLLGQLERSAAAVSQPRRANTTMLEMRRIADILAALNAEITAGRALGCRRRMQEMRAGIEDAVLAHMREAPIVVLRALPADAGGAPDLDAQPDPKAFAAAERQAMAVVECGRLAEAMGKADIARASKGALITALERHAEALIRRLDASRADRPRGNVHLMTAMRLLELVAGPRHADRLRQRCMRATGILEFVAGISP